MHLRRIPALDGLRGAAVLAVVAFHAGHLTGGYLGVDLFFVLSGFLITTLLLREIRATGSVALGAFWSRRLRRLLPALLVVLAGVAWYAARVARPVDLATIRADAAGTLLYVANWQAIVAGHDYWDLARAPSPLAHTWSLAIEEQFYLVWPVVLVVVARVGSRRRAPVRVRRFCLAGAVASAVVAVGLAAAGASDTRVYEGTDTRAVALLLGAALAAARLGRRRDSWWPSPRVIQVAGGVAGSVLLGAWVLLPGSTAVRFGLLPVCSALAATVVAAAVEPRAVALGRILSWPVLGWFGLISYGLYLWHWPVMVYLNEGRTGWSGSTLFLARLAVSVVVAAGSYHLVEQPIRQQRWRMPAPALLTGVAVAAVAGLLVWSTTGAVDPVGSTDSPEHASPDEPVLRRAVVEVPGLPRVLVVGDSVATSLARPALADPGAYRVNPADASVLGCSAFADSGHRMIGNGDPPELPFLPCGIGYADAVRDFAPDIVVGVFGASPVNRVEIGGRLRRACDRVYDAELTASIRRLGRELTAGGARLVLATVPTSSSPWRDRRDAAAVACTNRALRRVATDDPDVRIVDLAARTCPRGPCEVEEDPEARPDGTHFDGQAGTAVAAWLFEQAVSLAGAR